MMNRKVAAACVVAVWFAQPLPAQKPGGDQKSPPSEAEPHKKPGGIEWAPSIEAALAQSAKDGRPVITYWTFDT